MATTHLTETTPLDRAWRYYQHADTIQHSRHNFFMVAQAMLVAAFATLFAVITPDKPRIIWLLCTISIGGMMLSFVWLVQARRLTHGMTVLLNEYLGQTSPNGGDAVYQDYVSALTIVWPRLTGSRIFDYLIPFGFATGWLLFLGVALLP